MQHDHPAGGPTLPGRKAWHLALGSGLA